MAEQLDLTTPETFPTPASVTYWKCDGAYLRASQALAVLYLLGTNGEERTFTFKGVEATTYIKALNKRDASVVSNNTWTLNQLKNKGYLDGTISGTPD